MMKRSLFSFSLFLFFLHLTKTLALSPAAPTSPLGPANIMKILEKAGNFTTFIRLIKATHVDIQLSSQLKSSGDGITILVPSDSAFSILRADTLNSLADKEKVELVQFHVLTQFLLLSQFDTVSNPVMTLAGSSGRLLLNITVTGNVVNITTGIDYATISDTIYTDNQVAIYQIDKMLLPFDLFAPGPVPAKPAESPENDVPKDASSSTSLVLNYIVVLFELCRVAEIVLL
ncbi:hypothetical protein P3X46_010055 [Hevea brasiliensis]|uniref:FAS1 domain-containing protein n=1 Tax=Hevea brasiliensis TaxID=3981 RepID=A0ABQ9MGH5_HEVBR|nr:fasciclin-like arabinogalactan protein 12 [Hevea brasiliensis]KAJ9178146.1 hypothetical protein P3X46_010055 [Hevea brasiliensis]